MKVRAVAARFVEVGAALRIVAVAGGEARRLVCAPDRAHAAHTFARVRSGSGDVEDRRKRAPSIDRLHYRGLVVRARLTSGLE